MEKKLTDEEIVKDMIDHKNAAENYSFVQITGKQMSRWLDLIHRLQTELEEKNTYEEKLNSMIDNLRDDNAEQKSEIERLKNAYREGLEQGKFDSQVKIEELQKQVEELKLFEEEYNDLAKKYMADTKTADYIRHRAVKDTAKEVLTERMDSLKQLLSSYTNPFVAGDKKTIKQFIATIKLEIHAVKIQAEHYGVEVE